MQTREHINGSIPTGMRPGKRELGVASVLVSVSAAVPDHMQQGVREVSHLYVPTEHRRRRLGTALLNLVCQEADANCITLLLTARPSDASGPSADELIVWYIRFGFQPLQDSVLGLMMARRVQVPNRVQHAVHQALH